MDSEKVNKKAQMTIFIILGITIAFAIIILSVVFINLNRNAAEIINPKKYIESCMESELKIPLSDIMVGGGSINPGFFIAYNGQKYNYLCYSPDFYKACVNTIPQIKTHVEKEIRNSIYENVKACFSKMKSEYEKKGYSVSFDSVDLSISIMPGKIIANSNTKTQINKENETQVFEKYSSFITSDFYDVLDIVNAAVNEEATRCSFESIGYMLLYPDYEVKIIKYYNSKIYQIGKRGEQDGFKFAVRGCAYPQGEAK